MSHHKSVSYCLVFWLRSSTVSHKLEDIDGKSEKTFHTLWYDIFLITKLKKGKKYVCVYAWGRLHPLETLEYCCLLVWIQHMEIYTCTHWVNSAQMPYYRGICVQRNLLKHKHLTALTSPKQNTNGFSKHHFEMWFSNRLNFTA